MKYLLILISIVAFNASASSLPSLGSTGTGSEVRTAAGATCKTGTQRTIVDVGMTHKSLTDTAVPQGIANPYYGVNMMPQDTGMVYARIVIPIGAKESRINCKRMYNLEIQRMQTENALLRKQLEQLRNSAVVVTVE